MAGSEDTANLDVLQKIKKMFKYFVVLFITLVSAGSFRETAYQLTSNMIEGMMDAARKYRRISTEDKNSAIRAMTAVRDQFPAYCVQVLGYAQTNKIDKLKTAHQTVLLLGMETVNMTTFAMNPNLWQLVDYQPIRGWGKKKSFDRFELEVIGGALTVLDSNDTLELIVEAL
jgi:hypothetical protein